LMGLNPYFDEVPHFGAPLINSFLRKFTFGRQQPHLQPHRHHCPFYQFEHPV